MASGFLKQSVALPLTTDDNIDNELTKVVLYGNGDLLLHTLLFSSVNSMHAIGYSVYNRSSGNPVTAMTP